MANDNYSIDFIITWVDGNDPEWQAEKAKYSDKKDADTRAKRYRDWDSLKYVFRGIETFAPWVNRVFLVTCGHLPEWLNVNHPKLKIIKHNDYIPDEYLPTFSSRPIDMNFHRISDLSEHFVYFNDDMFLLQPVERSDFFSRGLPCDAAIQDVICAKWRNDGDKKLEASHLFSAPFYDIAVLNRNFQKKEVIRNNWKKWYSPAYGKANIKNFFLLGWDYFTGFKTVHLPYSYLKSTYEEVWEKEPEILSLACQHRFRTPTDVNHFIFSYWQYATGTFTPRSPKIGKLTAITGNERKDRIVLKTIRNQERKIICINDHFSGDNFEEIKTELNNALESVLKEKSGFEL